MPFSTLDEANKSDVLQDTDNIDYPLDSDGEELYAVMSGTNQTLGVLGRELFGVKKALGEKNRRHGATKFNGNDIQLIGLISTTGTQVNGTGTDFTKLNAGDWIGASGGVYRCVQSIISATQLVIYQAFPSDLVNVGYVRLRTLAERLDLIEASIRRIGEPLFLRKQIPISTSFPYFNLKSANIDLDIASFPDYVPYLQSIEVNINDVTVFPVIGYTANGSHVTIQLQSNATTDLLLKMLNYDKDANGGFTSWKCLTIDSLIGNLPAGDYTISGLDLTNRTITFPSTVSTAAGVGTMRMFHHRIAGQPTKARHFRIEGRSIMSTKEFKYACGFRIPDSLQDITVLQNAHTHVQDSHTHTQDAHTHTQDAHTHVQDSHTHVQDSHTHTQDAHTHTQDIHGHSGAISGNTSAAGNHRHTFITGAASDTPIDDNSDVLTNLLTGFGAADYTLSRGATNEPTLGKTSTPRSTDNSTSEPTHVHSISGSIGIDDTTATNQNTTATNQSTTATNQDTTPTNQTSIATNQNTTATNQNTTATNQNTTATNKSFADSGAKIDDVTRSEVVIYEMYEFVGTYIP